MKDNAVGNLRRRDSFKYAIVGEGVIIGLITGALISVFRLMLMGADVLRDRMVEYAEGGAARAALAALILLCIAGVISVLLGWEPEIAGSGIPQVEAELKGQKDMRWLRVIIGKVAGCALAIGCLKGRPSPAHGGKAAYNMRGGSRPLGRIRSSARGSDIRP